MLVARLPLRLSLLQAEQIDSIITITFQVLLVLGGFPLAIDEVGQVLQIGVLLSQRKAQTMIGISQLAGTLGGRVQLPLEQAVRILCGPGLHN